MTLLIEKFGKCIDEKMRIITSSMCKITKILKKKKAFE